MKISEVISSIKEWHQPFNKKETRDTVKCGDTQTECKGIVVTVCATVDVLKKARELGANLIISHESIFFGDEFTPEDFEWSEVYKEKKTLVDESGIVVWRDHDHMHGTGKPWAPFRARPDYIFYGIMKELGWDEYVRCEETLKPTFYEIPETTAGELAQRLLRAFGLTGMRTVGDMNAKIRKVYIAEHVLGRDMEEKFRLAEEADAIIPLEINDWTVSAFVRDAAQLGHGKVIFEMGHFNVEELGMKYMLEWLPEAVGTDIPIHFVPAGDNYGYVLKNS